MFGTSNSVLPSDRAANIRTVTLRTPILGCVLAIQDRPGECLERTFQTYDYQSVQPSDKVLLDYGSDRSFLEDYQRLCDRHGWRMIRAEPECRQWSLSAAYNLAVSALDPQVEVVFKGDVDVLLGDDVLETAARLGRERLCIFSLLTTAEGTAYPIRLVDHKDLLQILRSPIPPMKMESEGNHAYPRRWFEEIGGFDLAFSAWGYEDSDLRLRAIWSIGVERPTEPLLIHQWHTRSYSLEIAERNHAYYESTKAKRQVVRNRGQLRPPGVTLELLTSPKTEQSLSKEVAPVGSDKVIQSKASRAVDPPMSTFGAQAVHSAPLPSANPRTQARIPQNVLVRKDDLVKPWVQHQVTVCIPHLDTPDILAVSVRLWQLQRNRPFLLVIDTGSVYKKSSDLLEQLSQIPGIEVARLGIHSAVEHLSDRVSIAMDYAFSRCPTEYLLATHIDMFPKHRGLVEKLVALCGEATPVVGWEMSPRGDSDSQTGRGYLSDGYPGHVCTLFHMPVMDRIGAGWSIRRAHHAFGLPRGHTAVNGWPDTELCLGKLLFANDIKPVLLGRETNDENQETDDWLHSRSSTIHLLVNQKPLNRHSHALWSAACWASEWEQELLKMEGTRDDLIPYRGVLGLIEFTEHQTA